MRYLCAKFQKKEIILISKKFDLPVIEINGIWLSIEKKVVLISEKQKQI